MYDLRAGGAGAAGGGRRQLPDRVRKETGEGPRHQGPASYRHVSQIEDTRKRNTHISKNSRLCLGLPLASFHFPHHMHRHVTRLQKITSIPGNVLLVDLKSI